MKTEAINNEPQQRSYKKKGKKDIFINNSGSTEQQVLHIKLHLKTAVL